MQKLLLKDQLFNPQKIDQISSQIKSVYPSFAQDKFQAEVLEAFDRLELKERIRHISNMLHRHLPDDFIKATTILLKSLPNELDSTKSDGDFGEFIYASYSEFIALWGCREEYLNFSLEALKEITKRFSAEYAIREFINSYPKETLQMLELCSRSDNYHLRRLASEGLRPKLPWAKQLEIDYHLPLEYLDNLFCDQTRFVTRSVANHLNDISKIDAPLVIDTLKRWQASSRQRPKEMEYICKHALRTLLKEGNQEALALLGYADTLDIAVSDLTLTSYKIDIDNPLSFSFDIEAKEEARVMVDYIIYFKSKRATPSRKVYKLKSLLLKKGEKTTLAKTHPLKPDMSTRKLYDGEHKIELQINGKCYTNKTFLIAFAKGDGSEIFSQIKKSQMVV